ncbi:MAG TPA: class I SAM-dependent methyltransferase [Rhizorhapis sp.]|nr:class I SAM-dependent methyltransferase [Rhizorhapis sp.]
MITPLQAQSADAVRRHYDDLSDVYREIWGDHLHHGYWRTGKESQRAAVEALVDLVAEQLQISSGQAVCDIGCGYGAAAQHLAERHDIAVTGLTISPEQAHVAAAIRPAAGSVHVLERDWLANSLPDGCFDGAYAIESTEHIPEKQAFFDEAWRTLRPGGRLVVCAWLADGNPSPFAIRHLLEPICREGRLPGMGSRKDYEDMAWNAGFSLAGFTDLSGKVARTWPICMRRLLVKFVTERRYRAMVFDPALEDRIFLRTIPRLMIALQTGAMRYGIFTWRRGTGTRDIRAPASTASTGRRTERNPSP